MTLSQRDLDFLEKNHSAAMITADEDDVAKAVRVGVAMVGGRLWSSGTEGRVRTDRLRRNPACTLFVFESPGYGWVTLEAKVTVLDGPDVPEQSLQLFRVMQAKPEGPLQWFGGELTDEQFRQAMVEERRVIYEFDVHRAYGMR
jgi:hypothetical protein